MATETQTHSGAGYLRADVVDGVDVWLLHTPDGTAHSVATHEWDAQITNLATSFYDVDALEKINITAYLNGELIQWDESWVTYKGSEIVSDSTGNFTASSTDNAATTTDTTRVFTLSIPGPLDKLQIDANDTTTTTGRNILYKQFTDDSTTQTETPTEKAKQCFKTLFGVSFDELVKSSNGV